MTKRTFGVRVGVAVAACAMAAQGAAMAADPAGPLRITQPVDATRADVDPGRLYSNPHMAIDPTNPLTVVAGYADYRTRQCGLMRSLDGGASWTLLEANPSPSDYPFCVQTQGGVVQAPVAFGGNGMLYMALGGWDQQDGGARVGGGLLLARSDDLGDSWQTTVAFTARGKTGDEAENPRPVQGLAVQAKNGTDDIIYMTFARAITGPSAPNLVAGQAAILISKDGGRTFGEPIDVGAGFFTDTVRTQAFTAVTTTIPAPNATPTPPTTAPAAGSKAATPNQEANFGAARGRNGIMPGVDGDGNIYVAWPTATVNVDPAPPSGVVVSRSTDGGSTWTSSLAIPFGYENPRGGPANSYQKFAVSKDGVLHMVYGINPLPEVAGYGEVFHQFSTDGGQTWSERNSLTDSGLDAYAAQYFPNLSIAPNGRVDVAWWDVRDDPGVGANDVYYSYSNDNGVTWSENIRITDRSVDRRFGVWGRNYDITSQPGVASSNNFTVFGWDDTRANVDGSVGSLDGLGAGVQDLYTAAVQFAEIGGGTSSVAKGVLAGVVGLLAVGLVLLAISLVGRRGNPPVASAAKGQKATAKVT